MHVTRLTSNGHCTP